MSEPKTIDKTEFLKDKKKNRFRGIPEYRIDTTVTEDVKKIYQQVRDDVIYSGDLARIFNLKNPASGRFYERLYSLIYYGLLEKRHRGNYALTNIAKGIVNPDDDQQRIQSYKDAVLSVPLWKELSSFPNLPSHIWISIKKITRLTTDEAQEIDSKVREWFVHDNNFIQDLAKDIETSDRNNYSSDYNTIPSLNTQATTQIRSAVVNDENTRVIPFANMEWRYPESLDTEEAWNQFKDYMEVYLKYEKKGKNETEKVNVKNRDNVSSETLRDDVEYSQMP